MTCTDSSASSSVEHSKNLQDQLRHLLKWRSSRRTRAPTTSAGGFKVRPPEAAGSRAATCEALLGGYGQDSQRQSEALWFIIQRGQCSGPPASSPLSKTPLPFSSVVVRLMYRLGDGLKCLRVKRLNEARWNVLECFNLDHIVDHWWEFLGGNQT